MTGAFKSKQASTDKKALIIHSSSTKIKTFSQIHQYLPPGISLVSADDFKEWQMDIRILDSNPIYLNKIFRLRFRFSSSYPIGTFPPLLSPSHTNSPNVRELRFAHLLLKQKSERSSFFICDYLPLALPFFFWGGGRTEAPEVTFVSNPPDRTVPIHPHIYSNGIICLDLLGKQGWSPVQNVESVCMSIQSMLTGNTKNERPPGDEEFVQRNTQRPRDIRFVYEDSTV